MNGALRREDATDASRLGGGKDASHLDGGNDALHLDGAIAVWWRRPGRAWLALALLLALGSALGFGRSAESIDWQPALAFVEPWRAFSAAFVHYSNLHLLGNAAGLALTAAYGWAARVPPRLALAWLVAWPLTQLGLLAQPSLAHYGGLSGVVHAGVAIVTLYVIMVGHRWIGTTVLVMLFVKLATESPFGAPLRQVSGWDIALAPFAHASGVAVGLLCCALTETAAHFARNRAASRWTED